MYIYLSSVARIMLSFVETFKMEYHSYLIYMCVCV